MGEPVFEAVKIPVLADYTTAAACRGRWKADVSGDLRVEAIARGVFDDALRTTTRFGGWAP
jgi:hypothetical protein